MMHSRELERLATTFGWVPRAQSMTSTPEATNQHDLDHSVASAYSDEAWRHIEDLATTSWWYRTRNQILADELEGCINPPTIWDVGGGSGVVAQHLMTKGFEVVLIEPTRAGAMIALERGVPSLCSTLENLQLPSECLPALGLFDVLEHIENRARTLSELSRVLVPGGHLVLTLPAITSLWSGSDLSAGHFIRYNKRTIRRELELHGFEIQRLGYFFALTVLPLFILRALPYRLGFRKPVAEDQTLAASGGVFGRIAAAIERRIAMRTPIGTSLLVVARKSAGSAARND